MARFRVKRPSGIASRRASSRPVRPSAFNEDRLFTNVSFPIRAQVPLITRAVSAYRLTHYWQYLLDIGKFGSLPEIAASDGTSGKLNGVDRVDPFRTGAARRPKCQIGRAHV